MRTLVLAIAVVALATRPAAALKQGKHADITHDACVALGFSESFCSLVADAAYNTDANEFENLAAHAQPDATDTQCSAAMHTMQRLFDLGRDARAQLRILAAGATDAAVIQLASDIGRVAHTIEDNCAHSGIPNPQHAYWTVMDICRFTSKSPDIQPEAVTCAKWEAAKLFESLAQAAGGLGVDWAHLVTTTRQQRHFPPTGQACAFMAEARIWDGHDRRWENETAVLAFRSVLADALRFDVPEPPAETPLGVTCAQSAFALTRLHPDFDVDTGKVVATNCATIADACSSEHADGDQEPPWERDETDDAQDESVGGCSASGGGAGLALALLGLALSGTRRTRSSDRS